MEHWQIDELDIFHLIAEKKLFPSIFLNDNLDFYFFDDQECQWDLHTNKDDLQLSLDDDDYAAIYEFTKVKGFYYLRFERQSLEELATSEVQKDPPRSRCTESMWHMGTIEISLQFGQKCFNDNNVVFIKQEIERCEREKVVALDKSPKTDAGLIEKLKRAEQSLSAANSELDRLKTRLSEAHETIDCFRRADSEKPLNTKERNGLLTVIAALCDYSAVKYNERGAAGQIGRMMEEIGAPLDDDTIRGYLKKIPDALETRKK